MKEFMICFIADEENGIKGKKGSAGVLTIKGGKMVYRWLCMDGNPNVSYMMCSWQGYISKILNHNELPVGEFLCGRRE